MFKNLALRALLAIQALKREEGQTLAEYGLIMSAVAVALVVLSVVALRGSIVDAFGSATDCLHKASSTAGC